MDALVADVAVAGLPDPVPVVMKAVLGERLQGRRPGPKVIVDAGRHCLDGLVADGVSPLIAKPARQINLANHSLPKLLDALAQARARPALRAVLDEAVLFLCCSSELAPLPPGVGARLLAIDVPSPLAGPKGGRESTPLKS